MKARKLLKPFISEFKRDFILGDVMALSETETSQEILGKILWVKLFGLFWKPYCHFYILKHRKERK